MGYYATAPKGIIRDPLSRHAALFLSLSLLHPMLCYTAMGLSLSFSHHVCARTRYNGDVILSPLWRRARARPRTISVLSSPLCARTAPFAILKEDYSVCVCVCVCVCVWEELPYWLKLLIHMFCLFLGMRVCVCGVGVLGWGGKKACDGGCVIWYVIV